MFVAMLLDITLTLRRNRNTAALTFPVKMGNAVVLQPLEESNEYHFAGFSCVMRQSTVCPI